MWAPLPSMGAAPSPAYGVDALSPSTLSELPRPPRPPHHLRPFPTGPYSLERDQDVSLPSQGAANWGGSGNQPGGNLEQAWAGGEAMSEGGRLDGSAKVGGTRPALLAVPGPGMP